MRTIGKVHFLTDLRSGESSNGQPWEEQTVVVEEQTSGKPRCVAVSFMGMKYTEKTQKLQKGDMVVIDYGIRCTEYTASDGVVSWFTKLDGYGVEKLCRVEMQSPKEPIGE